jgi:hypothetical protein
MAHTASGPHFVHPSVNTALIWMHHLRGFRPPEKNGNHSKGRNDEKT